MPFEIAAEEIEKPDLAAAFADTPEMKSTFSNRAYVEIDGAIWIENLTKELLPYATHILDWYHVKEKLWKCAKELFGENSERCPIWVEKFSDKIWNGKVDQVVAEIFEMAKASKLQTPLLELHQYFFHRTKMMRYDRFREAGIFIGSGAIESANRYAIQDRLKKSGMKWSIAGANAIAQLRTLYLSNQWGEIWATA